MTPSSQAAKNREAKMRNLEARVIHAENMVAVLREVVDQLQAETERLAKLTEAR